MTATLFRRLSWRGNCIGLVTMSFAPLFGRCRTRVVPGLFWAVSMVSASLLAASGPADGAAPVELPVQRDRGYAYIHDEVKEVPWSVHIFKVDRSRRDLVLGTTSGEGAAIGMGTIAEQVKALPAALGTPLAAVNGDFYLTDPRYSGDPRDLHIRQGELVSAPAGHACFWMSPAGEPCSTNVVSRFRVQWPDGSTTPFGLNEARPDDGAVLYSAAVGASTRTAGGTEIILENAHAGRWLPLAVGQTVRGRVRLVRDAGDSPLNSDTLVLSLGPKLAARAPRLAAGAELRIVTETFPDLTGVTTAIGGGPTLVRDGKAMTWSGLLMRHPRTAVGWDKDHLYLVEVDGRQSDLSVGMTFPELAAYLAKLGCEQAMNLDGGGSATMWVFGQVMNSPSEGRERPGANALVVLRQKRPQEQVRRRP